jgi:hypothetical protein
MTIPAISAMPNVTEPHAEAKAEPYPPTRSAAAAAQPYVNPSLRLDPALGLVVIEFRDEAGELTSTIPSQRQIEAYRVHARTPSAPAMAGIAASQAEASPTTGPPADPGDTTRGAFNAQPPPTTVAAPAQSEPNGSVPGEKRAPTDVTLLAALASAVTVPPQSSVRSEEPIRPEPARAPPVSAPAASERSPAMSDTPSHGA